MAESNMEDLFRDIEDIQIDTQDSDTSTDTLRRLNALKKTVSKLKSLYQDDKDAFLTKYQSKLNRFNSSLNTSAKTFQEIHKLLEDDHNREFRKEDYIVISKTEWQKKLDEEGMHVWEIKIKDEKLAEDVNKRIERSVNKDKLCSPGEVRYGKELRIVILGNTGVGKSATGNLILGKADYFLESYQIKSQTETICEGQIQWKDDRTIRVVDTPGLRIIGRSSEEIKLEFAKCYSLFNDGVHAFLLVLNAAAPRFTEHLQAAKDAKKIFGKKAMNHCILVFTHFDEMQNSFGVNDLMDTDNDDFRILMQNETSGRVMLINNHADSEYEKERYRNNLIAMIDQMQNQAYSNRVFGKIEKILVERKKKKEKEKDDLKEKKLEMGYKDLLNIKIYIGNQRQSQAGEVSQMPCLKDIQTGLSGKMQILEKMPSVYESILEMIIEDEPLTPVAKNLDRMEPAAQVTKKSDRMEATSDWKNHVDKILLHKYVGELASKKTNEVSLTGKVRKEFSVTEKASCSFDLVSSYIREIRKSYMKEVIESTLTGVHTTVSSVSEEVLLSHTFTSQSTKYLSKLEMDALVENITDKLYPCLPKYWSAVFSKEDLIDKASKEIIEKYDEYKTIAKTSVEGLCFPASGKIYTLGGKKSAISELQVGDKVLTVNASGTLDYEDIVFLSHADHTAVSAHISITTDSNETICLSPLHLLHVGKFGNLVPAREVQVGDTVLVYDSFTMVMKKVVSVNEKEEIGLFCPHTRGGSIIVNDILASCYTAHFVPGVAHCIMSVVSVLYQIIPTRIFQSMYGRTRLYDTPRIFDTVKSMYSSLLNG